MQPFTTLTVPLIPADPLILIHLVRKNEKIVNLKANPEDVGNV